MASQAADTSVPLGPAIGGHASCPPAASVPGGGWSAREGIPRAGRGFQAQGGTWKWPALRLLTGDWSKHPGGTFPLGPGGQEAASTRPELLHIGVFAVFAKADVAFIRSGFVYHDCRSLIGKPGPAELRGRQGHRWSQHVPVLAPSSSLSSPHLVAGSSLEAQQQVEKRQMPPRMASREALQPK